jgi:M6 family metalloprotease-like protein
MKSQFNQLVRVSLIAFTSAAMTFSLLPATSAATIKSGQVCTKPNQQIKSAGKTFVCKKSGTKFVWRVKSKQKPTTPTAPAPVVETKKLALYTGGPGGNPIKSFDLPVAISAAPSGTNLKIWVYDPANRNQALISPGAWYRKDGGEWTWLGSVFRDGSIYASLSTGKYLLDVTEPNPNYLRTSLSITVDNSGIVKVKGREANSAGYYTVTLADRRTIQPAFTPTSRCQLAEQNVNPGMNVGFPKSPERLTSNGVVRALIVPIDFANYPGSGNPAEIFYQMADQMNTYFKEMSNNRVSFDFKILNGWQRAGFDPNTYKLGTWSGGDSGGYYQAALETADPVVDYSQFDVVYVFSPKNIPSSVIAYGPAFPSNFSSEDGLVKNGTISGADAYREGDRTGWRWMAHETGHLFGIHDLYTVDTPSVYGDWDIMSNSWGDTLELNSWNRYIQGWLADSQVRCLEPAQLTTPVEVTLNALHIRNTEVKSAMVRLSDTEILVAEVRRNGGYDKFNSQYEGVLVYKVDLTIQSIKGGYQVQRRTGSTTPNFIDALLKKGDRLLIGDIEIEVMNSATNGDSIKISKR